MDWSSPSNFLWVNGMNPDQEYSFFAFLFYFAFEASRGSSAKRGKKKKNQKRIGME